MAKNNSEEISVLVTGVGGGGHGAQILKALRLAPRPYKIIGGDMNLFCKGFAEVDVAYRLPPATAPDYIDVVLRICRKHNIKAVFHGSEAEMMVLAEARDKFKEANVYLPINPGRVLEICQNKVRTARFLQENGFETPEFREIVSMDQLAGAPLPAVLKPSIHGGGSAYVFIAQTQPELEIFSQYLLTIFDQFILQEYVGTADQEFTVGVLFAADGTLLNSIAVQRIINNALSRSISLPNRTGRKDLGQTLIISSGISQGKVGRFPEITSQCTKVAQALNPTAPINIQCRYVDNQVVVFEVNPRFSGTTSIRAMVGYNEPDILIRRDILGEEIEPNFAYREDIVMRGLSEVRLSTVKTVADGRKLLINKEG